MSLSTLIKKSFSFYPAWNKLDTNLNQLNSLNALNESPLPFWFLISFNMYSQRPKPSAGARCQRAFTQQRRSELSGRLCLTTQWTIQVESPSAHTPANTLHCCHRTRLKFYTNPVVMESRRKSEGGWWLKKHLGQGRQWVDAAMRKTERVDIHLWETETVRRDNVFTAVHPPPTVYI